MLAAKSKTPNSYLSDTCKSHLTVCLALKEPELAHEHIKRVYSKTYVDHDTIEACLF